MLCSQMMLADKPKLFFLITKGNWGGAQRYVYDLATAQTIRDQFKVTVVLGQSGQALPLKLEAAGVSTRLIPALGRDVNWGDDWRAFWQIKRLCQQEHPAILHLNSSKAAALGALAARLAGVPKIIFTVHGWPFREARPYWQRQLIKLASWLTTVLATDVVVLGRAEQAAAASWPWVGRRLRLIRHGLTPPRYLGRQDARTKLLASLNCPSDFLENKLVIGSIGELHPNKGYGVALAALAELSPKRAWAYIIIGGGEQQAELEQTINRRNLGGQVFLTGFLADAGQYLNAFDLFLLPSTKEGLPYVLLEAGGAGLPVIASAVGAIPELIEDGFDGRLVPAGKAAILTQAIIDLTDNDRARRRLGDNLLTKIRRDYQFAPMVEKTLAVYLQKI